MGWRDQWEVKDRIMSSPEWGELAASTAVVVKKVAYAFNIELLQNRDESKLLLNGDPRVTWLY